MTSRATGTTVHSTDAGAQDATSSCLGLPVSPTPLHHPAAVHDASLRGSDRVADRLGTAGRQAAVLDTVGLTADWLRRNQYADGHWRGPLEAAVAEVGLEVKSFWRGYWRGPHDYDGGQDLYLVVRPDPRRGSRPPG